MSRGGSLQIRGLELLRWAILALAVVVSVWCPDARGTEVWGTAAGDRLGSAVALAGDLNRDGYADLAGSAESGDSPYLLAGNGSGYAAVLGGLANGAAAESVLISPAGTTVRSGFGGSLSPTLRAWMTFSGGTASVTTASIGRTVPPGFPLQTAPAGVYWSFDTDRTEWSSASLELRYVASEVDELGLEETSLTLFTAPGPEGPWRMFGGAYTLEPERKQVFLETSTLPAAFALAEVLCELMPDPAVQNGTYIYGETHPGVTVTGIGLTSETTTFLLRRSGGPDLGVEVEQRFGDVTSGGVVLRVENGADGLPVAREPGVYDLLISAPEACDVLLTGAITIESGGLSCADPLPVQTNITYSAAGNARLRFSGNSAWITFDVPPLSYVDLNANEPGSHTEVELFESCADAEPFAQANSLDGLGIDYGTLQLRCSNPLATTRTVIGRLETDPTSFSLQLAPGALPMSSGASCLSPVSGYDGLEIKDNFPSADRPPCVASPTVQSAWVEITVPAENSLHMYVSEDGGTSPAIAVYDYCGELLPVQSACGTPYEAMLRYENASSSPRSVRVLVAMDGNSRWGYAAFWFNQLGYPCTEAMPVGHGDAFGPDRTMNSGWESSTCVSGNAAVRWVRMEVPPETTATVAAASGSASLMEDLSVAFYSDCATPLTSASQCAQGYAEAAWFNADLTTMTVLARFDSPLNEEHPEMLVWFGGPAPDGWTCTRAVGAECDALYGAEELPAAGSRRLAAFTAATSAPAGARWLEMPVPPRTAITAWAAGSDAESTVAVGLLASCGLSATPLAVSAEAEETTVTWANNEETTQTVMVLVNSDRELTAPVVGLLCEQISCPNVTSYTPSSVSYSYGATTSGPELTGEGLTLSALQVALRKSGSADRAIHTEHLSGNWASSTRRVHAGIRADGVFGQPAVGTYDLVISAPGCTEQVLSGAVEVSSVGGGTSTTAEFAACGGVHEVAGSNGLDRINGFPTTSSLRASWLQIELAPRVAVSVTADDQGFGGDIGVDFFHTAGVTVRPSHSAISTGTAEALYVNRTMTTQSISILVNSASSSPPLVSVDCTEVPHLAAGWQQMTALRGNGELYGWGANWGGQLGLGATGNRLTPVRLLANETTPVLAVAANTHFAAAVMADGTVRAFGKNDLGQTGDGTTTGDYGTIYRYNPVTVKNADGSVLGDCKTTGAAIACGWTCVSVAMADGRVFSWGGNTWGALGDGTTPVWPGTPRLYPGPVKTAGGADFYGNVVELAAGQDNTLARLADGTVWGWGYSYVPGHGGWISSVAVQATRNDTLQPLNDVVSIAVGSATAFAVCGDGSLWGWGHNLNYELTDGTTSPLARAKRIKRDANTFVTGAVQVWATAGSSAVVLLKDGTLLTWGRNYGDFLGLGTSGGAPVQWPTQVPLPAGTKITAARLGGFGDNNFGNAFTASGARYAWGWNPSGQAGDGSSVNRMLPVLAHPLP